MEKNDILIATAASLGTNGEGIVKTDPALFVPFLLPGERAKIQVLQVKRAAYGKALEIITPAEERVRPKCAVFTKCGGCQLQHLRYKDQLKFKTKLVEDSLKKIGNLTFSPSFCLKSEREFGYRNKLSLPVGREKGKNVVGFYAERSHRIVPLSDCPIHPEWTKKLILALLTYMDECGLKGYDETDLSGEIRHIVVREVKRKFLVTLVCTQRKLEKIEVFLSLLDRVFPEYSLFLNYHPENTNVIFGKEFSLIKGKGFYESEEYGIRFEAGVETFLQVNDCVKSRLYESALFLAEEKDSVFNCYSGGGLLTAMFAKKCALAVGIEIVPEAHRCAERLKQKNGLERMENILGDVKIELESALEKREKDKLVVLDPPRAGVERGVIRLLLKALPEKILMISCNPSTLARDLGLLCGTLEESEKGELLKGSGEGKYRIESVQPFDMFPQTKHVETLAFLKRI